MKRHCICPRQGWQQNLERMGFSYHSIDGNYWQEDAYYAFSSAQIDELEQASNELHCLYHQALSHIIKTGDYHRFGLNDHQASLVESSIQKCLQSGEFGIYGRFDLAYDGVSPPKLLEYNADTPTALFEASVAQWYWLKDRPQLNNADQFNSIHERLIIAWQSYASKMGQNALLYFTAYQDLPEDFITCRYLQDTAIQAGLATHFLDLADIGYDEQNGQFVDLANRPIDHIFKLYPWEWLSLEPFGQYLNQTTTNWLEPAYKLLFSNKTMLVLLWELFPNHKNLLPTYFSPCLDKYAKKPFFSREGANISLYDGVILDKTTGEYGQEGYVYQALCPLPKFINNHNKAVYTVVGSWVVGGVSCGIGIREDGGLITKDSSLFVPHLFYE